MESRQLSATAHEMMNNGDAFAHQQMAQTQKTSAPATVENATSFSEMDDYEKAMVIHQSMNNAILSPTRSRLRSTINRLNAISYLHISVTYCGWRNVAPAEAYGLT
ncbi:hypothetical protein [Salmonella enterica]|uniref:hypothetical protein n=1 Tax=Salmonella enterica TaxID=28901 RepID=UPI001F507DE6|nr:hypothetical protein [Salmonella enterica]